MVIQKRLVLLSTLFAMLGLLICPVMAQDEEEESQPAAKDAPYFSGMPNYRIIEAVDKEFDWFNFYNGKDCTRMEGRKYYRSYTAKDDAIKASELQILRNYSNAVKKMGGTILFEGICNGVDCAINCGYDMMVGKIMQGKDELWIEVVPFNEGMDYYVTLVVKESMKQDVTASGMLEALNRDGHVTLYINFDTNRSVIKNESLPIIEQIVSLMRLDENLELNIEGHTDNVGDDKSNQILSEARAKAVVSALVSLGIDQKRMSAVGYGESRPIADNSTEDGRAKNRRVELVKRAVNPYKESTSPKQSMHFGIPVYPGAKLDLEQTEYAKFDLGDNVYVYRTNDSVTKVSAFFGKVGMLKSLVSDDKSALFVGDENGKTIRVAISNPWEDGRTGETHHDTIIQYVKEE